jgi:hypothetical protein
VRFYETTFSNRCELNDKPANLDFRFVRTESPIFFRKSAWRMCEAIVFWPRHPAFVAAEPNAVAAELIQNCLLRNAELFADLRS